MSCTSFLLEEWNPIIPNDFSTFGVLMMVIETTVKHVGLKSPLVYLRFRSDYCNGLHHMIHTQSIPCPLVRFSCVNGLLGRDHSHQDIHLGFIIGQQVMTQNNRLLIFSDSSF